MKRFTHELIATASVSSYLISHNQFPLSIEIIGACIFLGLVGGLTPDVDSVSSVIWKGKIFPWRGEITRDFLTGHRHISHSILGMIIFSGSFFVFLIVIGGFLFQHSDLFIASYIIGYVSHLVSDSLTIQGVPWLYPIKYKFGFPPLAFLRIKTGGFIERKIVLPLIIVVQSYLVIILISNLLQKYF